MDHNKLRKILQEMEISGYLTHLLRNLYAVKKQQLELDMEQMIDSKLEKEYCHTIYLTYMQNEWVSEW